MRPRPSPKLRAAVCRQRDLIRSPAEAEFGYLLDRVGQAVPGSRDTPELKRVLGHWYQGRTLDIPPGWHREVEDDFRKFHAESPWRSRPDGDSVPLSRCRALLGLAQDDAEDAEVRFHRDALQALAAILIQPDEPRIGRSGSATTSGGGIGCDGDADDESELGRLLRWPTGEECQ